LRGGRGTTCLPAPVRLKDLLPLISTGAERRTALHSRPARQPTKLAFHASRIVIDIGVLMVLGSMSLAFITTEAGNRSALAADALPTLLLLLPIFVITLLPDHSNPIPDVLGWLSLILGFAAFPYALIKYLDASTLAGALGGSVGWGARLHVFGACVVIGGIGIGLARSFLGLPAAGTYPSRSEPRWIRHSQQRLSRKATAAGPARHAARAGAADRTDSKAETITDARGGASARPSAGPTITPAAAKPRFPIDPDAPTRVMPAVGSPHGGLAGADVDDEATTEVVPIPDLPARHKPVPHPHPFEAEPADADQPPLIPDFLDASAHDPDEPDRGPGPGAGPGG